MPQTSPSGTITPYHLALAMSASGNGGIGLGDRHGREADLTAPRPQFLFLARSGIKPEVGLPCMTGRSARVGIFAC